MPIGAHTAAPTIERVISDRAFATTCRRECRLTRNGSSGSGDRTTDSTPSRSKGGGHAQHIDLASQRHDLFKRMVAQGEAVGTHYMTMAEGR